VVVVVVVPQQVLAVLAVGVMVLVEAVLLKEQLILAVAVAVDLM
jgi:hypothetical protein